MAKLISINGETHKFPDEATHDQINMSLKNYYGNSQPQSTNIQNDNINNQQNQNPDKNSILSNISQYIGKNYPSINKFAENPYVQTAVNTTLGAGDSVKKLLSLGYANKPSSSGTAYEVGKGIGDIGSFLGAGSILKATPYLKAIPELLNQSKLGALGGRLLGSEAYGLASEKDRPKGALQGLEAGALGEAIRAPFSAISKISETINPIKYAEQKANEIYNGAKISENRMKEKYGAVLNKHGENTLTINPEKYLNFSESQIKRFTPEVKKIYDNFIAEPNFQNLHDLQSQMGKDWARLSRSDVKFNTAQVLKRSRDSINNKIDDYLTKIDPEAKQLYSEGKKIAREEYYPYHSSDKLTAISEGLEKTPSPNSLKNIIKNQTNKVGYKKEGEAISKIPEGHHLRDILKDLQKKENIGTITKYAIPAALVGAVGGTHFDPAIGSTIGAGIGALLGKTGTPAFTDITQNPIITNLLKNYGSPISRAISEHLLKELNDQ